MGVGIVKKVLGASPMNAFGNVMNVVGATSTFSESRGKGDSVPVSVAKTVGDFAFYEMLGGWGMAYAGVKAGVSIAAGTSKMNAETLKQATPLGSGRVGAGYFDMSQAGYTMRQRALNQIRNNGQQINSVLGSEARTFARSVDM